MKCEDCKHWFDNGSNLSSCDRDALLRERDFFCAAWERKKPFEKPTTNADRIRAMSDEELAQLFADDNCGYCHIHDFCYAKGCQIDCENMWIDWLKSPVEVDNGA